MSISSYLNLQYQFGVEGGFIGERLADVLAVMVFFLVNIFYPCACIYVALVPEKWLPQPNFKGRWGTLYNDIRTNTFGQRIYYFMFVLRRGILVYIGMLLRDYPYIQIQLVFGCNIVWLIYKGKSRPFKTPFKNKLELNTEMFFAVISYHLVCFTDFISRTRGGLKARYDMGYSFMVWTGILIVINFTIIFIEFGRKIRLYGIKNYYKLMKRFNPDTYKIHQ